MLTSIYPYWPYLAGLLVALVLLRGLSGGRFEVKLTDAVIVAIPVLLWLVGTGQIKKLIVSSDGFTVESAIIDASHRAIAAQVTPLPVVPVELAGKGPVGDIPSLAAAGIDALQFQLGAGFYVGSAIAEYLDKLTGYPSFRYVVVTAPDGTFFGVMDARALARTLEQHGTGVDWNGFAEMLNGNRTAAIVELGRTAGFVGAADAVTANLSKRDVLGKMDTRNTDWLPVVDEAHRFKGVVERSRLTASMLLDIAAQLQGQ